MLFLDVALGLILVFVVASLVCTSIVELIASVFRMRARALRASLGTFLGEDGKQLYAEPMLRSLRTPAFRGGSRDPSYIPTRVFSLALMNRAFGESAPGGKLEELVAASKKHLSDANTQRFIEQIVRDAGGDVAKVKQGIADWFDAAMERASGFYKRRTQIVVWAVSMGFAASFNVDTLEIIHTLSRSTALRATLVATAEDFAVKENATASTSGDDIKERLTDVSNAFQDLTGLGVPVGWSVKKWEAIDGSAWITKVLGLLLTALATSLGAPFWFDLLSKMVALRGPARPKKPSPAPTTTEAK